MPKLIDENAYPDCEMCGGCCARMGVLAVTEQEYHAMLDAVREGNITPIDRGEVGCPLMAEDGRCMIWSARPQVCRLHHCRIPRIQILEEHPEIQVPENLHLICLRETFVPGVAARPECLSSES